MKVYVVYLINEITGIDYLIPTIYVYREKAEQEAKDLNRENKNPLYEYIVEELELDEEK